MQRSWIIGSLVVLAGLVAVAFAADPFDKEGRLDKEEAVEGEFVITTSPYGTSDFVAIRFHSGTGDSWRMSKGKWVKMTTPAALPAGQYDVVIASSGQNGQNSWNAFLLEIPSGKSWRLTNDNWKEVEFEAPVESGEL